MPTLYEGVKAYDLKPHFDSAGSRYYAFNVLNKPTFELRHFRGTLKPHTLMGCIEYADCLSQYVARENVLRCRGDAKSWSHWYHAYARKSGYEFLPAMLGRFHIGYETPVVNQPIQQVA